MRTLVSILMLIVAHALGEEVLLDREKIPLVIQKQLTPRTIIPKYQAKISNDVKATDWRTIIDSTWGEGLPVDQKLQLFDTFWHTIDKDFACFQDLNVDWDSLRFVYRTEVENQVSRGRFAAIMNHLALSLKESHTYCDDKTVNWYTKLVPGVPLLYVGGWGNSGHFGAGLTPLPDSTLLVYKTIPDHPLGLTQGDIVLGYDGVPWKTLYSDLIEAELPITGRWWGCSESAYLHSWLMSAGMNWHLFKFIDIVKYETGDTLHLSTELLKNQNMDIFCSEQLEIPGVPMKNMEDLLTGKVVSSGIVQGTQIGYIYVWAWYSDVEEAFYNAVDSLMNKCETTGLILDFRTNFGGNMFLSNKGLELLFNSAVVTIGFGSRRDPTNHFSMYTVTAPSVYEIDGDSTSYYNKPIAVLTGPGARSSGDQVALRMKFHPKARIFGKSTTASFNSPTVLDLDNFQWYSAYANADAYLASNRGHYITHDEFIVDENVWLTKKDVALGHDTVVEAAISWINNTTSAIDDPDVVLNPRTFDLNQNYPNPFNLTTRINFSLPRNSFVKVQIYDIHGRKVAQVMDEELNPGEHKIIFNAKDLSSGVYFYRIQVEGFIQAKRMVILK